MGLMSMDEDTVRTLFLTVECMNKSLGRADDSWRDHLEAIRNITSILEFNDTISDQDRRQWQLPLMTVFQRVAYADADSGGVPDIANWCLKQAVTLLQVYPEDVELLTLIGRNWLSRAQRSLSRIHLSEQSSSSSGESSQVHLSSSEENRQVIRGNAEAESIVCSADYVEARGILLPAVEYLQCAVNTARSQGNITGDLLTTAAEACMSLGNVSSPKTNCQYFQQALSYLQDANELTNYNLPLHLQSYLEDYGSLME
ncbi:hypothetical protein BU23DRAFT_244606 [Bimuria novae-zelandiae CBS 107.79]|uniref:Uncharacterized protein n=1 Tax=Bimuria novae-zelandiae CBS 107.79 TaxID=1447943 RepID=A0A6A5UWX2_9PLEO|nr:hypothetical protein BU23DRAFT_244606 [Bimuria novae-zelandiae CBS 107.79]